jgi:putative tryptophan/tyrosine transport system substrate-binding protein
MMKRREFLAGLSSAVAAWPSTARGQQAMPVIGFLAPMSPNNVQLQTQAFHRGLAEAGYEEGKNINVQYRWGDDRIAQMPALAADLVHRQVDVIAAFSTVSVRAAKNATSTIPIVFMTGDDPIASGIVTSFNRPGANVTGVTFASSVVGTKRFELLRTLVPSSSLIAVLNDPNSPESQGQSRDATQVAQTLGQPILALDIGAAGDIDPVFATMAERKVSAFFASGSPFLNAHRHRLSELALRYTLPGVYANRNYPEAGGLISYGASILDAYRQTGLYVGRILKGAHSADLPVLQPTKFELVINLKTAKAMGLAVPDRLLALADQVIE